MFVAGLVLLPIARRLDISSGVDRNPGNTAHPRKATKDWSHFQDTPSSTRKLIRHPGNGDRPRLEGAILKTMRESIALKCQNEVGKGDYDRAVPYWAPLTRHRKSIASLQFAGACVIIGGRCSKRSTKNAKLHANGHLWYPHKVCQRQLACEVRSLSLERRRLRRRAADG